MVSCATDNDSVIAKGMSFEAYEYGLLLFHWVKRAATGEGGLSKVSAGGNLLRNSLRVFKIDFLQG